MKLALLALLALAGCTSTGALTPQAQNAFTVFCKVDAALVPLAQPFLGAASAADALVHPLVLAACANLGGVPASAVATLSPSLTLSVSPTGVSVASHGATVTTNTNGTVTVVVP